VAVGREAEAEVVVVLDYLNFAKLKLNRDFEQVQEFEMQFVPQIQPVMS